MPYSRSRYLAWVLRIDVVLVVTTLLVAGIGVVMVYAATRDKLAIAGFDPRYFLKRQMVFVVLGVAAMVVLLLLDYRWLEHAGLVLYGGLILALLAMFSPLASHALGATRWISIGSFQLQPSAFGSLVLIVLVASYCSRRSEGLAGRDVIVLLLLAAVPILLVAKQPDLGSALVMTVVLLPMLAVAGLPIRYLVLLVLGGILVAFLAVGLAAVAVRAAVVAAARVAVAFAAVAFAAVRGAVALRVAVVLADADVVPVAAARRSAACATRRSGEVG
jgi:rod shape determining protein RodA